MAIKKLGDVAREQKESKEALRLEIRKVIGEELKRFEPRRFKFRFWEDAQGPKYEVEAYATEDKEE